MWSMLSKRRRETASVLRLSSPVTSGGPTSASELFSDDLFWLQMMGRRRSGYSDEAIAAELSATIASTLPDATMRYQPLRTTRGVVGVLGPPRAPPLGVVRAWPMGHGSLCRHKGVC